MVTSADLDDALRVRDVSAEFVALVCADEELLAAEFEAIIAAGWPPAEALAREGATPDADGGPSPVPAPTGGRPGRWMPSRSRRRERSPPPPRRDVQAA